MKIKQTGVGQDRQYASTFSPNGLAPKLVRKPYYNNNGNNNHNNNGNHNGNPLQPGLSHSQVPGQNNQRMRNGANRAHYRASNTNGDSNAEFQPRYIQKTVVLEEVYKHLDKHEFMTHSTEEEFEKYNRHEEPCNGYTGAQLPVLTLKNSLSKISFCDRECFNVNDNPTKEAILKYIEQKYKGLNIIDNQYVIMKPHMLKNITYHEHMLTTFTNGNPYLLFLTRIDNVPCSIFIDRKVKDGYCYPKIHCVQYKFAAELFDTETVFTGELVRDVNRNFQYLISDLLVHNGEYIKNRNILARFQLLHNIMDNQYTADSTAEICPVYVKRLFQYADIKYLLTEFIPTLTYTCKGIVFHTLNNQFSDYAWILPKEKQISVKRKHEIDAEFYKRYPEYEKYADAVSNQMPYLTNSTSAIDDNNASAHTVLVSADALGQDKQQSVLGASNYYAKLSVPITLLAMQTEIPDIINLYTQDNLTDKLGYAFIPNLKVSQMLYDAFKSLDGSGRITLPVNVTYHRVFQRWIPFEIYDTQTPVEIDTTASLENKKKINKLVYTGDDSVGSTIGGVGNITAIGIVPGV